MSSVNTMAVVGTDEKRDLKRVVSYGASCGAGGGGMHETLRKGIEKHFETERVRALELEAIVSAKSGCVEGCGEGWVDVGGEREELVGGNGGLCPDAVTLESWDKKVDLRVGGGVVEGDIMSRSEKETSEGLGALECRCMSILSPPISKKSGFAVPTRTRDLAKSVNKRPRRGELGPDYVNDLVTSFIKLRPCGHESTNSDSRLDGKSCDDKKVETTDGEKGKDEGNSEQTLQLERVISVLEKLKASKDAPVLAKRRTSDSVQVDSGLDKSEGEISLLLKRCRIEDDTAAFMPYIM